MNETARALHPHKEKVYVKVSSDTDQTGYVRPRTITWTDGRKYEIEDVKDFRPADTVGVSLPGDCYTVVIRGQTRHLFFERIDARFHGRYGRWFVEIYSERPG